jgi:hypothetical protein
MSRRKVQLGTSIALLWALGLFINSGFLSRNNMRLEGIDLRSFLLGDITVSA